MHISKVKIQGFKCFNNFELPLNEGLNIIVGDNEAGKSTVLEAINLTLTGLYNGRYLKNELSEYLFNIELIDLFRTNPFSEPEILIELFFEGENLAIFEGDCNSEKKKNCGISLNIAIDESDKDLYNDYVTQGENTSLPIEYYDLTWKTFAREIITTKNLPFKSALIDSSSYRYQNGSDVYLSHIIRNYLEAKHKNGLTQAHRRLQDKFRQEQIVKDVNEIIKGKTKKFPNDKEIKVDIDLSSRNAWEYNILPYVEQIPFQHIGKGYQQIVKTKLALEQKKALDANIILLEEPENHLSHSKLNQLVKEISGKCYETDKQIIITTHSSFVANKLGLDKLILLYDKKYTRINDLTPDTIKFFKKISGYDTLRLILCDAAILCEGDSDELIIQKCYLTKYKKLPIEDSIEVISVGLSFSRYLEIAARLNKKIAVITDNDGKSSTLIEKYKDFNDNPDSLIKVYFDLDNDYSTLEPQLIKYNNWEVINQIIDHTYKKNGNDYKKGDYICKSKEELLEYMTSNKTECALKFFETDVEFTFPEYIEKAINHVEPK